MNQDLNIFLLIGQSNMAGRCNLDEVEPIENLNIFMFREGQWTIAREPLHTDKPTAGSGLAMSFALDLLKEYPRSTIGLVPCAVGGTPLNRWIEGGDLYSASVTIVRTAMSNGSLKGILWHQGEFDSQNRDDALSYGKRFTGMINALRKDLQAPDIPFISGGLGEFLKEYNGCAYFNIVNKALKDAALTVPCCGYASSEGLKDQGDAVHFDSSSLREFGHRYAREYLSIIKRHGIELISKEGDKHE